MPEERKLVSVLFVDVVGSTALGSDNDPEVVRSVMARYFERMKTIAETHGGTVEKFIGDAVMAVFGVPRAHDDDAERAVRAAMAMRDAMPSLEEELGVALSCRIGVNSGEAVAGTAEERQFLVTGDVVNVGARLQQNADPGEVVVGELTERLTRQAIEYRVHEPIKAKGKSEPLVAFTAVRPRSAVPEQARGLPQLRAQLVGRQRELSLLLDTFSRVSAERRAHLFTLVGNAGVGKSRLVGESLARLAASGGVRVLRGRCLPYGSGITYWPFIELLREDAGTVPGADRATALERLERRVGELVATERDRRPLVARLGVLLGLEEAARMLPEVDASRVASELAWAMRRYVESVARVAPLVLVVDDLQWGEPPLVDAVEQIAERVREAPLLLLCIARPELLEARPAWGSGKPNATLITLDPLSPDETRTLVARLLDIDELPDRLRAEIVARSEGNPLFCEEFLRVLIDDGAIVRDAGRWRATAAAAGVRVPETIQAVLTARLDLLPAPERRAMQVASVVGERFDVREVASLDPSCGGALDALVRKGLVVEDEDGSAAGALRFKHLLIRDAAYASLPKSERGELHDRFGRELEREIGDRVGEVAEILEHHVERAFAIAEELRVPREVLRDRARRALEHSITIADRAVARGGLEAFARFVETAERALPAAALPDTDERSLHVELLRLRRLENAGRLAEAVRGGRELAERALGEGQVRVAAEARLVALRATVWSLGEVPGARERFADDVRQTASLFQRAGDPAGARTAELLGLERFWESGLAGEFLARGRPLLEGALSAGDTAGAAAIAARLAAAANVSARGAEAREYLALAERLTEEAGISPTGWLLTTRVAAARTQGDVVRAEALIRAYLAVAEEWAWPQAVVSALRNLGTLLLSTARDAEAETVLRRAVSESERTGETWNRTEVRAMLAVALARRGDFASAERLFGETEVALRTHDVFAVAEARFRLGQVRSLQGRDAEAEELMRAAVATLRETEFAVQTALVELQLAEFLADRERHDEAAALLAQAEARFVPAGFDLSPELRRRIRERLAARASG